MFQLGTGTDGETYENIDELWKKELGKQTKQSNKNKKNKKY
jgi:hypothetical protein